MTTRTVEAYVCECGHKGYVVCRENDAPYSSLWESYSLDGFGGGKLTITNYKDMPADIMAALKARFPSCGRTEGFVYAPRS